MDLLADNIRRVFRHLDNAILGFGGPSVLDSVCEECRVEREDFTEPSKMNFLLANDESHELLAQIGASGGL